MTTPKCAKCGNEGDEGALYLTVDAKWVPSAQAWMLELREDDGGSELDCCACDHRTPVDETAVAYGAMVNHG